MIRFDSPYYLILLSLIPLYLYWEFHPKNRKLSLVANRFDFFVHHKKRFCSGAWLYPILRSLILLFLIIAISKPQWGRATRDFRKKGVDIAIAMDISGSMLALDFMPQNRLSAAIAIAKDFVSQRPNDRFSLVAFSEYALTASPLTYDHRAIMSALDRLQVNEEASGTAIGMGLAKALSRLKNSDAKSRIVILITDGVNNAGEIDPISSARMAKSLGIKVYPIGVGREGLVPFPFKDSFGMTHNIPTLIELDMDMLHRIASITGTKKAARANDAAQLRDIMRELNELERTELTARISYKWEDHFCIFLFLALALLALEIVLKGYIFPVFP